MTLSLRRFDQICERLKKYRCQFKRHITWARGVVQIFIWTKTCRAPTLCPASTAWVIRTWVVRPLTSSTWQFSKGHARLPTKVLSSNFPLTITESKKHSSSTILPLLIVSYSLFARPHFLFLGLGWTLVKLNRANYGLSSWQTRVVTVNLSRSMPKFK